MQHGELRTGDLATVDEDGYFTVVGRLKRFAKLFGRRVSLEDVDHVEWYVGIFAEEYPDYMMMGELLTTMVANDAFTQALTNPLLSRNVYTEQTAPGLATQPPSISFMPSSNCSA